MKVQQEELTGFPEDPSVQKQAYAFTLDIGFKVAKCGKTKRRGLQFDEHQELKLRNCFVSALAGFGTGLLRKKRFYADHQWLCFTPLSSGYYF